MNRYSKIKLGSTSKSRSMDFSDLQSFNEKYTKPIEHACPKSTHTTQESNQIKKSNTHHHDSTPDSQEDAENHDNSNGNGEGNHGLTRLSRNGSVSSSTTASKRFSLDKQSSPRRRRTSRRKGEVESVVKRAFSMRRSSSVSERYCRIHDQCVTLSSPLDDNDGVDDDMKNDTMQTTRSMEKKKQGYISGRLLKACKRILGL